MLDSTYWSLIDAPRKVWDPTEGVHRRHGERPITSIDRIECHYPGQDGVEDHGDTSSELLSFERFHEVTKGWADLFYNVALDTEGNSYEGRDVTIKSQAGLETVLTLLCVVDINSDLTIAEYNAIAVGIWRWWGAADPQRRQGSLGYHSERSSTGCPGDAIREIVTRLWAGWIPPGATDPRSDLMYATVNTTTGDTTIHTTKGTAVPSEPGHWLEVIEKGRETGIYRSPFFDQLDALIWQQAGGDEPSPGPVALSSEDVSRIALATADAVLDEQARRLEN